MQTIELLNIPNYFSSYYLKGLNDIAHLEYRPNIEFKKYNGLPLIIFRVKKKLVVIDNRDPVGVSKELYDLANLIYVTNRLQDSADYNQDKIRPLFPHYPINTWELYLKIFGISWYKQIGWKNALREIYIQNRRPSYKNHSITNSFRPYVFFSGSIWKQEIVANEQRSSFIKACQNHPHLHFEGGMVPRDDRQNLGLDDVLGPKRYSYKEFNEKSCRSLVNFNNPAVLGAISWRFAEYLNMGTFILSLPWKTELPVFPVHGKEIHIIEDLKGINELLSFLLKNPSYHRMILKGGKTYFHKYCQPKKQGEMIMENMDKI
ncbi:glycosyltransferase [Christiangramia salexigens]|uniref:Glycosyltransferase family 1 protein n=1 Tax=Christiangramia salexigens TaxID=1913577 RepID=A0A1L3J4R6_9FLAO|nr:glycosyltransferase [Christiangramia salexigens]APG60128.1 hypothetical protein LPB144_06725 [Christiangramia salexigens]